ncbi:MAG: response regulator [SAR324 cluster bacterium]|jgi:two-component system response regulator BaeR|nr:two-component system response regulator BaeR [Deltaproteobacteria bacterium]MDP6248289.1 response regulator [SAR324 cluster bacterium]
MKNERILVVEDEPKIAELHRDYLDKSGFQVRILNRGDRVVDLMRQDPADLILLDLMLPRQSGIDVCRELRSFSNIPIIMITAKTEEIDRLLGLELGADDYICKPFSPREVVARVKAVLRRSRLTTTDGPWLKGGPIRLNSETREVLIEQNPINLTPNEFGLLEVLLKRPGRVYSRDELLTLVQGYDYAGYDRTIDTHIKNLRKKLQTYGVEASINSVYGVGYRFQIPS